MFKVARYKVISLIIEGFTDTPLNISSISDVHPVSLFSYSFHKLWEIKIHVKFILSLRNPFK